MVVCTVCRVIRLRTFLDSICLPSPTFLEPCRKRALSRVWFFEEAHNLAHRFVCEQWSSPTSAARTVGVYLSKVASAFKPTFCQKSLSQYAPPRVWFFAHNLG